VTERTTDRRLWIASATAEDVLEERALLGSILQYIRTRVTLARDLAHEMERCRPAQVQFRARGEAPCKPGWQAARPARRESN
jgi:hypothetical protein